MRDPSWVAGCGTSGCGRSKLGFRKDGFPETQLGLRTCGDPCWVSGIPTMAIIIKLYLFIDKLNNLFIIKY